jgi:hypothetical protein
VKIEHLAAALPPLKGRGLSVFEDYQKTIKFSTFDRSCATARSTQTKLFGHVVAAAFLFPTPYQTPTELPVSRLQKHPGPLTTPFYRPAKTPPMLVTTFGLN